MPGWAGGAEVWVGISNVVITWERRSGPLSAVQAGLRRSGGIWAGGMGLKGIARRPAWALAVLGVPQQGRGGAMLALKLAPFAALHCCLTSPVTAIRALQHPCLLDVCLAGVSAGSQHYTGSTGQGELLGTAAGHQQTPRSRPEAAAAATAFAAPPAAVRGNEAGQVGQEEQPAPIALTTLHLSAALSNHFSVSQRPTLAMQRRRPCFYGAGSAWRRCSGSCRGRRPVGPHQRRHRAGRRLCGAGLRAGADDDCGVWQPAERDERPQHLSTAALLPPGPPAGLAPRVCPPGEYLALCGLWGGSELQ